MTQADFVQKHLAKRLGDHRRITQDSLVAINPKLFVQVVSGPIEGSTGSHIRFSLVLLNLLQL